MSHPRNRPNRFNYPYQSFQWFTNRTLRTKLVMAFLIVSMLILGAITWIATHTTSQVLAEETGNNLSSLAHVQALAAGDLLARQIDIIQALSANTVLVEAASRQNNTYNDAPAQIEATQVELDRAWVNSPADGPLIRAVLANEAADELKNFQKQFPNHVEIFVTDRRGALLAATNRISDYYQADERWWQQAYQQGQGAIFLDRLAFDESSNTFGIKMAVPMYHPQTAQLVGILQTVYRIGYFNNLVISPVSNQAGVLIDLLLPDGQLIARDGTGLTPLAPDTLAQLESSAGKPYAALTFEGVPRLVSQAPVASLTGEAAIDSLAWRIIVSQNQEIVLAALASQQRMIVGMALLAAGLAALMAVTIASWLAQPITRLTDVARQIGDGNLSIEAPVSSNDEIGRLALTFNYMTARLRQLIGSLEEEIKEHQQTEAALKESEEKFRRIFETMLDSYILGDMDGNVVLANPAASDMLGYTPDELLTLNLPQNIYRDAQDREDLKQLLTQQHRLRGYSIPLKHKDGRVIIVEANIQIIYDEQGLPFGLEGMFRDVTQRKEAEQALQQSNQQLLDTLTELQQTQNQLVQQERIAAIGQLAGGIAHDFNNILVPIIGYAELGMMELNPDDKFYFNFQHISQAAERAATLTRQILAFSRKQVLQVKPLDLNTVITEFQEMLQRLIGEDLELKVVLSPSLRLVQADPAQIEQILLNLAINARDAMPLGGKLTIETTDVFLDEQYTHQHLEVAPGPYVMLAVSDTGTGMDTVTLARIFEPFFTTKPQGKGTGLGLATVFGIVRQHGGSIWVYSEPGQGTTFKIYLPQIKDGSPAARLPDAVQLVSTHGSETVLVVEDELMVRKLACETLRAHGYHVLEAPTSAEALRLAAEYENPIHLILTDVVMPQLNGRQLYRQVLPLRPQIRVLYMSGYTDDVIVHHGLLDNDVNFLQKPFTIRGLTQKVREVLGPAADSDGGIPA